MYKKLLCMLCLLLGVQQTQAQILSGGSSSSSSFSAPADKAIYIYIKVPAIISYVTWQGKPVFIYTGINNIINQYSVEGFEKAYPTSRFRLMRQVYKMNISDTMLPVTLVSNYPQYFTGWELIPQTQTHFFYTPNDFVNQGSRNAGYLDSIGARKAWDYSKGNSNIVIGVHDVELDTTHPDLASKLVSYQNTHYLWG